MSKKSEENFREIMFEVLKKHCDSDIHIISSRTCKTSIEKRCNKHNCPFINNTLEQMKKEESIIIKQECTHEHVELGSCAGCGKTIEKEL